MKRFTLVLAALVATSGCDDTSSLCDDVTCTVEGTVCDERDGECHCGDDGPICSDDEVCDSDSATCAPAACAGVTCEVEGTVCAPDGQCHCGGPEGPVCGDDEVCDAESATCQLAACVGVTCEAEGTVCGADGQCHCGGPEGPVCGEYETCEGDEGRCDPFMPDAICHEGTRWSPGTPIFREATEDWNLTGVEGTRLNLADIDGDGYVDLLVRRGPTRADEFTAEGSRNTWLLHNENGEWFEDITQASGLLAMRTDTSGNIGRPNTIAAFADVDNDGDIDAFTGTNATDHDASLGEMSELMLNDGAGGFIFAWDEPNRDFGRLVAPAGASFVDYDRDGNVDLWVTQDTGGTGALQDRLFQGDGAAGLSDETMDTGLGTSAWTDIETLNQGLAHTRGWGAAACDLNGDGIPELLSPSYGRAPNHLWQGTIEDGRRVQYINRSVESGYAYDDDMTWQDNQFAMCFCEDNPEAEGCDEVGSPMLATCEDYWDHSTDRQPFRLGGNSGSTFCADVDNDGDIDLLTSEIRHWWAGAGADGSELLVNTGEHDVRFERPGDAATGLEADHLGSVAWDEGHMTNAIFDFDNDGWLDVYIGASDYPGNRGLLYHQEEPLSFVEVSVEDFFEHNRSHGVVFADLDRDGDLDVIVGHSRARCGPPNDCYPTMQVRVFENIMEPGNWVQLHLVGGEGTNRAAIGARAMVTAGGVTQTQEVGGGFGHYGAQNDLVLHFGLGEACEAEVTVRWPDADLTEETFTLPAGYRFLLVQGEEPRVAH